MMRSLILAVALGSAAAGDFVVGGLRTEDGSRRETLFLCSTTMLKHADMLYRVDASTLNVTASVALPADADADGWKKTVCGRAPAVVAESADAATTTLYWPLDVMYASKPGAGPAILGITSGYAGLAVATRTPLPIACTLARSDYCAASGLLVDGGDLWIAVNEYLLNYELPLTPESKPASTTKYVAAESGWACPDGYLPTLKSLTKRLGKLYGVAACPGDAPARTALVIRFHKAGGPEAWATVPDATGATTDALYVAGDALFVAGTAPGRVYETPAALYAVDDGAGSANLTVGGAPAAVLASETFLGVLSAVSYDAGGLFVSGVTCATHPLPPASLSAGGDVDLPPYCGLKEAPAGLVARVDVASGGGVSAPAADDVYRLLGAGPLLYGLRPGASGVGETLVKYDNTGARLDALASLVLPVVPLGA